MKRFGPGLLWIDFAWLVKWQIQGCVSLIRLDRPVQQCGAQSTHARQRSVFHYAPMVAVQSNRSARTNWCWLSLQSGSFNFLPSCLGYQMETQRHHMQTWLGEKRAAMICDLSAINQQILYLDRILSSFLYFLSRKEKAFIFNRRAIVPNTYVSVYIMQIIHNHGLCCVDDPTKHMWTPLCLNPTNGRGFQR